MFLIVTLAVNVVPAPTLVGTDCETNCESRAVDVTMICTFGAASPNTPTSSLVIRHLKL
ncbi:hypothetical protein D3C83_198090 [compost metagenome]